ncbi:hypothetical protein FCULG_00010117 [Fusarium culmorum]|uniref:BZIP domain-containing protein n=1 Tax=Fusarium culmorum TaxID=5516 RepID=A0A2T4GD12_FUSCU|nr:hypothetical protein FCULG_00010117 [Fusarium culmorum]
MSTPAQKANLARIRDNQRRSRARRREYLQELEQRLRVYELQGVEASSEVQHAARRVAEENRQLRGLLNRHGIGDDYISNYLNSGTATQADPTTMSSFASNTPSESVQSLQQVIAPRRPTTLETGVSYVIPPQDSREPSIASGSTSSSSLWEPGQSIQPGPAYAHTHNRPLPSNVSTPVPRHSITSSMHPSNTLRTCSLTPKSHGPKAIILSPHQDLWWMILVGIAILWHPCKQMSRHRWATLCQ